MQATGPNWIRRAHRSTFLSYLENDTFLKGFLVLDGRQHGHQAKLIFS